MGSGRSGERNPFSLVSGQGVFRFSDPTYSDVLIQVPRQCSTEAIGHLLEPSVYVTTSKRPLVPSKARSAPNVASDRSVRSDALGSVRSVLHVLFLQRRSNLDPVNYSETF